MFLVIKKCIIPIVHDLNNVVSSKINSTLFTASCKNCRRTFAYMVDVQKVNSTKLESFEKQKTCPREPLPRKSEDLCLADEGDYSRVSLSHNGVMDRYKDEFSADSTTDGADIDIDSSSDQDDSSDDFRMSSVANEIRKHLAHIRWTEYTPYAKELMRSNNWDPIKDDLITVVSYNVLSQILLEKHSYLYKNHDKRSLAWDVRSKILLDEFESFNADIMCFQEVEASQLNSFYDKNLSRMGYEGVYKQRTNDKTDGCAIYFKRERFSIIEQSNVELFKKSVPLLDRDNVGIIIKLGLNFDPKIEFVVATTHLLFNPRRGDIKLAQTQLMLAELDKMAYKGQNPITGTEEYLPIIFTGDMNYSPDNGIYKLVTESYLEYEGTPNSLIAADSQGKMLNKTLLPSKLGVTDSCQFASVLFRRGIKQANYSTGTLAHHLNLDSAYKHVKGDFPEASTNHDEWITVDYIYYSKEWDDVLKSQEEGNLKLISKLSLPNSEEAEIFLKSIPNLACGSDHFPLLATFQIVRPP